MAAFTCMVTTRSSTTTSFVKKSAPIVAANQMYFNEQKTGIAANKQWRQRPVSRLPLYWFEKRLFTYWFISDVLPTPDSPRMMTFSRTFFLDAIFSFCIGARQQFFGQKRNENITILLLADCSLSTFQMTSWTNGRQRFIVCIPFSQSE